MAGSQQRNNRESKNLPKVNTVKVRGKRYKLVFEKLDGVYGLCEHPETQDKTIRIDSRLRGKKLVEIVLHEVIHASCWDLDEEAVTELARDATHILERLGLLCNTTISGT
jgi:hypothetical protein